jgi:hypothetical protein
MFTLSTCRLGCAGVRSVSLQPDDLPLVRIRGIFCLTEGTGMLRAWQNELTKSHVIGPCLPPALPFFFQLPLSLSVSVTLSLSLPLQLL